MDFMDDDGKPRPRIGNEKKIKGKKKGKVSKSLNFKWAAELFLVTIFISATLTFFSSEALQRVGYIVEFAVLVLFILLGILFDIIGIAVTSTTMPPFNSMAARRVKGAKESIRLIKNADKVSSFCNDVVGDISGIISGSTGAIITANLVRDFSFSTVLVQLVISGIVSGVTVGGKALGKSFAIRHSIKIVHFAGRLINVIPRRKRKKERKS